MQQITLFADGMFYCRLCGMVFELLTGQGSIADPCDAAGPGFGKKYP